MNTNWVYIRDETIEDVYGFKLEEDAQTSQPARQSNPGPFDLELTALIIVFYLLQAHTSPHHEKE